MWLGRQRVSVTTYEYDDAGRLVRSITVHDAEWTDDDRACAQARRRNEADRCPGCGLPMSETTDAKNMGGYEAPYPVQCFACTPLEKRKAEYEDRHYLFHVQKTPTAGPSSRTSLR